MYKFKFVTVLKNGKTTEKLCDSNHEAHAYMAVHATENGLSMNIHSGRWADADKSVIFEGDDPMFNIAGYVAKVVE